MADLSLAELSPWSGLWRRGRSGNSGHEPGVVISEPAAQGMVLLVARKGETEALLRAAKAWGVELPTSPRWVRGREQVFIWAGPGQWLVRGPGSGTELMGRLSDWTANGAVIDQSHSRAVLSVSGPRARDVLAKGFDIDLHPRVFGPGDVALTQAAGISACLWQGDDAPTYEVAVPASFAGSFWHWLSSSAAEYGYLIAEPGNEGLGAAGPG